jgi:hypothetical protein
MNMEILSASIQENIPTRSVTYYKKIKTFRSVWAGHSCPETGAVSSGLSASGFSLLPHRKEPDLAIRLLF